MSKILSASSPRVWHETPFTATSVPKLTFFIPISADEKGCNFRFRILANHLASFFFPPVTECKHLLAFILTWICYFGHEELTYISIPLLTVSLWRPVNKKRRSLHGCSCVERKGWALVRQSSAKRSNYAAGIRHNGYCYH